MSLLMLQLSLCILTVIQMTSSVIRPPKATQPGSDLSNDLTTTKKSQESQESDITGSSTATTPTTTTTAGHTEGELWFFKKSFPDIIIMILTVT